MKTTIKFMRFIKGEPSQEKEIRFYSTGNKYLFLNGKLHREDGPAIEYSDGAKSWYLNGNLHREDGPARMWSDGTKDFYLNGNLHREEDYWKALEKYKKKNIKK